MLRIPQILRSFSKKERVIFMATFLIFITAFFLLAISFTETKTMLAPVNNGEYTEGVIGQPVFINPVLSENNTPSDDISRLIFASLKDIIDTYEISDNKKIFTVRIKGGLIWQDNQPLTTDDIIFTVESIQDSDTNSPLYQNWKGINIERVSEREIKISIPRQYIHFEDTMLSLRPIPKHIFGSIPFAHMKLSNYNVEPVGSGIFKFSGFEKQRDGFIKEIILEENNFFAGNKPYIGKFNFKFYKNETDLTQAFNAGDIDGFALADPGKISSIYIPHQLFGISMNRYYAIFLNPANNPTFKDIAIKAALNYATDNEKIIKSVFKGYATPVKGPIPGNQGNWGGSAEFSIEKANQILDSEGWMMNENGIREFKDKFSSKKLEFGLTVYPAPFLTETAKILQEDWAKIGVKLNLNIPSPADFEKNIIKTRNYDMLAFGNIYGKNVDPFSFWHSSQKFYPGLNLSIYENKNADFLIELIRTDFDPEKRSQELETLQSTIVSDRPAIFLYSPSYLYVSSRSLKGFNEKIIGSPSDRFSNIQNWYTKTVRVLK